MELVIIKKKVGKLFISKNEFYNKILLVPANNLSAVRGRAYFDIFSNIKGVVSEHGQILGFVDDHSSGYMDIVKEFHTTFGFEDSITQTTVNSADLRIALLQEELDELKVALKAGDKVETLDALCDLQYVLSGAILALGFRGVFDEAFKAVHMSNMSKTSSTQKAAQATGDASKGSYRIVERNGQFITYSDAGKVIKSLEYEPVNLAKFIKS